MGLDRSSLESGDIWGRGVGLIWVDIAAPGPSDGAAGGGGSWSLLPCELGRKSFPKDWAV